MKLIDNHPMLGKEVVYETEVGSGKRVVKGIVTGVRRGTPLLNMKTGVINSNTFRLRIKPNDGSRAIWTDSVKESEAT